MKRKRRQRWIAMLLAVAMLSSTMESTGLAQVLAAEKETLGSKETVNNEAQVSVLPKKVKTWGEAEQKLMQLTGLLSEDGANLKLPDEKNRYREILVEQGICSEEDLQNKPADKITQEEWTQLTAKVWKTTVRTAEDAEVIVSKQAVEVPDVEDKIYNGNNQKSGLSDTELYTIKSDDGGTNVSDKPSVTLSLKNPENYVWVTTENGVITEHSSPEYTVSYQIKKADLQLKVSANASITDLQYGQTLTSDPNPQKETVNNNQAPVQVKMSAPQMLRGYSAIYMRGTGEQTAERTWSWNVVNGKVTEKDGDK